MITIDFDTEVQHLMENISSKTKNTIYVEKRLACHHRENGDTYDFYKENDVCYRISYFKNDDDIVTFTLLKKEQVILQLKEILSSVSPDPRKIIKSNVEKTLRNFITGKTSFKSAVNEIIKEYESFTTYNHETQ